MKSYLSSNPKKLNSWNIAEKNNWTNIDHTDFWVMLTVYCYERIEIL